MVTPVGILDRTGFSRHMKTIDGKMAARTMHHDAVHTLLDHRKMAFVNCQIMPMNPHRIVLIEVR